VSAAGGRSETVVEVAVAPFQLTDSLNIFDPKTIGSADRVVNFTIGKKRPRRETQPLWNANQMRTKGVEDGTLLSGETVTA
jgi:hypothetical protein